MGMNDKQLNALIRFLLDDLEEIAMETDETRRAERLRKVIEHLRRALED